jgi:diadenosine tetraphosphatase ApaH/serine/threonine PP2A family protein phosphatase
MKGMLGFPCLGESFFFLTGFNYIFPMIYGIFSDIHSNLAAFEAVLDSMSQQGVQRRICLGDLVGYGVEPNECVALTQKNADICLVGNHDSVAIRWESDAGFNPYAKHAIQWTQEHLSEDSLKYMKSLPYMHEENEICFVHASPMSPADWVYITDLEDALDAFDHFSGRYCFVGHTHSPIIVAMRDGAIPKIIENDVYTVESGERLLMNVGSVGQPRDRDPRACWCLFDTELQKARLIRVEYDVFKTQEKMRLAGSPQFLIERLGVGR